MKESKVFKKVSFEKMNDNEMLERYQIAYPERTKESLKEFLYY
jgi:hypothetical protein